MALFLSTLETIYLLSHPSVSVITPVFNGELFLNEAIISIRNQSFREWEMIIVDDGSTDSSYKIAKQWQQIDSRLMVIHQENLGAAIARNEGIRLAKGKYLAFLDADDSSFANRLRLQFDFLEKRSDFNICGGAIEVFEPNNTYRVIRYQSDFRMIRCLPIFNSPFATSTVLIRKSILDNGFTFEKEFEPAEDYNLWSKLVEKFKGGNLNNVLTRYRIHHHQITNRKVETLCLNSDRVRARNLNKINISASFEELALHHIISLQRNEELRPRINLVDQWLRKLNQSNQTNSIYPEFAFRLLLGQRWFSLCASIKGKKTLTWPVFWQSNMSKSGIEWYLLYNLRIVR